MLDDLLVEIYQDSTDQKEIQILGFCYEKDGEEYSCFEYCFFTMPLSEFMKATPDELELKADACDGYITDVELSDVADYYSTAKRITCDELAVDMACGLYAISDFRF